MAIAETDVIPKNFCSKDKTSAIVPLLRAKNKRISAQQRTCRTYIILYLIVPCGWVSKAYNNSSNGHSIWCMLDIPSLL